MKIKKLITTIAIGVGLVAPVFQISQGQVVEAASINDIAKQNSYSGVTYLHKMLQTQGIRYNKFYAGGNKIKYRNGSPEGIVIHETATPGASAYNEAIYFNRAWKSMYSYVHAFVDHKQVIQMMTPKYGVWGAGAVANNRFIQIELCEENTRTKFAQSVNNDAIYAAKLLHRYNIEPVNASNTGKGTVWSHHAVSKFLGGTNHTDPDGYFAKWGYSMNDFFDLLKYYYDLQGGETDSDVVNNNPTDSTSVIDGTPASDNSVQTGAGDASAVALGDTTLMHDAYVYDIQGKRTSAALKTAGSVVNVQDTVTINNKKFLRISDNEYIVASNVVGRNRSLTHNAYIYNTTGLRVNDSKLRRGESVRTYGGRINIAGKWYYAISPTEFVKTANFR